MLSREEAAHRRAEMIAAYQGGMTITAISKKFEVSWGHANCVLRPERHNEYVRKSKERRRELQAAQDG